MPEIRSKVVLAGIGRGPFEAIAPVLERQRLDIERVESPEAAVEMACRERIDLIIFDADPNEMSLDEVVAKLRAEGSASAGCRRPRSGRRSCPLAWSAGR